MPKCTSNNKTKSHPELIAFGGILALTLLSGAVLTSSRANADNDTVVDNVSIEVPVACSMGGTGMNTHTATLSNGIYSGGITEYASGIGSTTLSILCNDNNGFSVYTIGYTNDEAGNNTLKGTNTNLTIPTGIYNSSTTTDSTWSMKVTKGTDSGDTENHPLTIDNSFDSFHTVPGEQEGYTRIAYKTAATTMSGTPSGATLTTTYDSYISTTQAADTYTGQVKYVMVHPYDHAAPTDTLVMQNVSTWGSSVTAGQEVTAIDARDGKSYTVARLADGKLWMTQNLDLAGGTKLDSEGSDVPAGYTQSDPYFTLPTSSAEGFEDDEVAYVYNTTGRSNPSDCSSEPGCYSYYSWLAATAGGKDANGNAVTDDGYNAAYSICPKGWKLPTSTTSDATAYEDDNWKTGDWYALATAYGADLESSPFGETTTFYDNAGPGSTVPKFLLAGSYYSGSFYNGGSYGFYWSSTSYSSTIAYYLRFNSGFVYSADGNYRSYGSSVRCVFSGQ